MQKISFVTGGNEGIASFRYRILAPSQFLGQHMIQTTVSTDAAPDASVVIFSKHWTYNDWSYAWFCKERGQKVIFDVCDDHFEGKLSEHYFRMCSIADLVICNSHEMQARIKEVLHKDSIVIEDPVISRQQPYTRDKTPSGLWYGQAMNINGLYQVYTGNYPLEIAMPGNIELPPQFENNLVNLSQWHPGIVGEASQRNSYAILPYRQGKNAKSANRVLEALWCGLPVITDPIPAVVDLGRNGIRYLGVDCENSEIMEYMLDTDFTEEMQSAQKLIELKYSPEAIASKWAAVIQEFA
jgi:hypothetical protein